MSTINVDGWVPLETARHLYKGGRGITRKSMREKVRDGKVPKDAVKKTDRGNYFFHLPTLMGLAKTILSWL